VVAGCASAPEEQEDVHPGTIARDPKLIHGYFLRKIRERVESDAAKVSTIPSEHLWIGLHNEIAPDLTRRIILGFEQHGFQLLESGKEAVARWCNPEFGISRDFRFVSREIPGGRLWKVEITREQVEELAHAGLVWFRKQREAADGRVYAYPPDWVAANVSASCDCGRKF
jgi:hypothetical protein